MLCCDVLCFVKCSVIIVNYLKNLTLQKEEFVSMTIGCQEDFVSMKIGCQEDFVFMKIGSQEGFVFSNTWPSKGVPIMDQIRLGLGLGTIKRKSPRVLSHKIAIAVVLICKMHNMY